MKILFIYFFLLFSVILTSCGKRVHIEDVSFHDDTVCYQGKPYTGEIWTDDDKTGCFRTEKGNLKSLVFYHHNGKQAISMETSPQGAPHTEIFDDEGNPIDMISFQTKYMDIWIKMAMVQGELMTK